MSPFCFLASGGRQNICKILGPNRDAYTDVGGPDGTVKKFMIISKLYHCPRERFTKKLKVKLTCGKRSFIKNRFRSFTSSGCCRNNEHIPRIRSQSLFNIVEKLLRRDLHCLCAFCFHVSFLVTYNIFCDNSSAVIFFRGRPFEFQACWSNIFGHHETWRTTWTCLQKKICAVTLKPLKIFSLRTMKTSCIELGTIKGKMRVPISNLTPAKVS